MQPGTPLLLESMGIRFADYFVTPTPMVKVDVPTTNKFLRKRPEKEPKKDSFKKAGQEYHIKNWISNLAE